MNLILSFISLIYLVQLISADQSSSRSAYEGSDPITSTLNIPKLNDTLNDEESSFPIPVEDDGEYHDMTLEQIMYFGNSSALSEAITFQFLVLDSDNNGNLTHEDVSKAYQRHYGKVKMFFRRLFNRANEQIDQDIEAMDTDGDGAVSLEEFHGTMVKIFREKHQVPSKYEDVCEAFMNESDRCSSIDSQELGNAIIKQTILCKNAFSWIVQNFKIESCVIDTMKQASNSSSTCQRRIQDCFDKFDSLSQATPSLEKRSLGGAPVIASRDLILDATMRNVAIAGLVILSLSIFWIAAKSTSSSQVDEFWQKQNEYERWMIGAPRPPCGTPLIYWSPHCGSLHGNTDKLCLIGQPLMKGSCKWWWNKGSRTCNVVGCKPLCFDVSTYNCPYGKTFTLGYDSDGKSNFTEN